MWKPLIPLSLLGIGYLAGSLSGAPSAQAQAPNTAASQPDARGGRGTPGRPPAATNLFLLTGTQETRAVNGKAVLWTKEQLKDLKSHIQWAPEYRLTMTTRNPPAAGQDPAYGEMHTDNTQIYVITGGAGTVIVEGRVEGADDYLVAPGEHRGGPIVGGRKVHVKEGDVISITPFTWHTAYGDPGTPLTYLMFHVHTRQTIP